MLIGTAVLWTYYLVALLALPLLIRARTRAPLEFVRKLQHIGYAMSVFLLLGLFQHWYQAVGAAGSLVLVGYPVLALWERHPSYQRLLTDRSRGGELRRQLLLVQATYSLLIGVFWGWLGPGWHPLIAGAVMVWGFGDAAAALVGRFLGRHRVVHYAVDGSKTYEGTMAMVAAGALAAFFTLLGYGQAPWWVSLVAALSIGPLAGAIELFSRRGIDTLTVPLASAIALVPWWLLAKAFGG